MRQVTRAPGLAPGLIRRGFFALLTILMLSAVVGADPSSAQAAAMRPLDAQAALTSSELTTVGLSSLISPDARVKTFPVGVRRWSGETHLDQMVFATSSSGEDERDAMVFIDAKRPSHAKVDCGFDVDVVQRRLGPTTCMGTQTADGSREPQFVAFGSMPVPGVNVTAVVGNPRIGDTPTWREPSTRERLTLARRIVAIQVAKLRAGGYLP